MQWNKVLEATVQSESACVPALMNEQKGLKIALCAD